MDVVISDEEYKLLSQINEYFDHAVDNLEAGSLGYSVPLFTKIYHGLNELGSKWRRNGTGLAKYNAGLQMKEIVQELRISLRLVENKTYTSENAFELFSRNVIPVWNSLWESFTFGYSEFVPYEF